VTAELRSPNGAEGAAVLSLHGEGIGAVTAWGDTEAHAWPDSAGVRIVLVHATGGSLSFRVALADTTEPPSFSIEEVAAPDDQLRTALGAYTLEFGR
jgi:hypothetical protein